MATSEIRTRQCGHHADLAIVFGHATQPGFLETELLLDHPGWLPDL